MAKFAFLSIVDRIAYLQKYVLCLFREHHLEISEKWLTTIVKGLMNFVGGDP